MGHFSKSPKQHYYDQNLRSANVALEAQDAVGAAYFVNLEKNLEKMRPASKPIAAKLAELEAVILRLDPNAFRKLQRR